MKIGGQILWNAVLVCDSHKISCLMGRHLVRGDSENHFEGPIIPCGAMVENITLFLRKTHRDYIN